MAKFPMTLQGATELKERLSHLKSVERPQLAEAIAIARAYGDLRENAEYKAAREAQSFCEGKIREIEHQLACAHVIDLKALPTPTRITFGTYVRLLREKTEQEVCYQIVGDTEADIQKRHLAISSPLAQGLIGKQVGECATISTPAGEEVYTVLAFQTTPLDLT